MTTAIQPSAAVAFPRSLVTCYMYSVEDPQMYLNNKYTRVKREGNLYTNAVMNNLWPEICELCQL